jgi:hypothetical protein
MWKPSKNFIYYCFSLALAVNAYGGWEVVKGPAAGDIWDLDFINPNSGWAGASGAILRYENGSWSVSKSLPGYTVWALSAYDENCVWASAAAHGKPNELYFFDGSSWTLKQEINDYGFSSMDIIGPDAGWGCGPIRVYRWNGETWSAEGPYHEWGHFSKIEFYDSGHGFLVGQFFQHHRYVGGVWSPLVVPDYETFYGLDVVGAAEFWAAGTKMDPWQGPNLGKIAHYRGGSWQIYNFPEMRKFESVSMADDEFGWAVGTNRDWVSNIIYKWDGEKWHRVVCRAPGEIWDVETLSRDDAWACGSCGYLLRYQTGPEVRPTSLGRIKALFAEEEADREKRINVPAGAGGVCGHDRRR